MILFISVLLRIPGPSLPREGLHDRTDLTGPAGKLGLVHSPGMPFSVGRASPKIRIASWRITMGALVS